MDATTSAAIAGAASIVLVGGAIVSAVRQARFARRAVITDGLVSALDPGSNGLHITFQAGERLVTIKSGRASGHYKIGQKLPVYYDPDKPEAATIDGPAASRRVALMIAIPGVVLLPVCVFIVLYVGPMETASERAARAFVAAAQSGLPAGDASVDRGAERQIQAATEFHVSNISVGFDDTACVGGELLPQRARLVLALAKDNGKWKVRRAAPHDAECDKRLED